MPTLLGQPGPPFLRDFGVDGGGSLPELGPLFGGLGEVVTAFLEGRRKESGKTLKPQRLRALVQAVADDDDDQGFTSYVERVGKDTKVWMKVCSHQDGFAPGFCSIVRMYWAEHVTPAVEGIRTRVSKDIRHLRTPT